MIAPNATPWVSSCGRATLHHGDCLDVMRSMPDGSVDAVVTDPPYGLGFMNKGWDKPTAESWGYFAGSGKRPSISESQAFQATAFKWAEAMLRVAKPGAHLLAFGGTRTFHRLTCAIEDAGWEIRDCLSWLYGSGFPKSHNGPWGGTALKPAWEPVIMARKPLIGTVAANHAAHGTGALNIDGCRIATTDSYSYPNGPGGNLAPTSLGMRKDGTSSLRRNEPVESHPSGRWPANVALDDEAARLLDEQSANTRAALPSNTGTGFGATGAFPIKNDDPASYADSGGASRFFYTAKASRSEREAGLREAGLREERVVASIHGNGTLGVEKNPNHPRANTHPTVKPVDLMRWLVRLVTPLGGTVLDPFLGSGTTLVAALQEGCRAIGIEREAQYVEIAKARVAHEAAQGRLFA